MPAELTLQIVGITFPNADGSNRRFELELCKPGDPVELIPEPRNPVDPRAVGVWRAGGGQLGYVAAERAGYIRGRLQAEDCAAIFQAFDGKRAFVRARFGGDPPTLPPPRPTVDADNDDFAPDPDGPDWGA